MKRKKLLAVVMIAVMMSGGCGNKNAEEAITDTNVVNSSVSEEELIKENETEETQSFTSVKEEILAKAETTDIDSLIVEKTDDELDLKQYLFSYEDRTMDKNTAEQLFYLDWFMDDSASDAESFITTDKVDLYNINGIRVGYTLKDAWLETFGECNGWYFFYLDGNQRFARVEDVKANSITREQAKAEEEANKQEEPTAKTETPVESAPVEQPVVETPPASEPIEQPVETPAESDKYTPEEAMSVYRSLMEAGGITWNPALKDVSSWGTGWLYLDKGYPELAASSDLESFAMGDSVGNSWTEFYVEVTGSDEEAVYFTGWHN